MIEKRIRIENEKHEKEIDSHHELERKRRNMEKLFNEIRYHRELEIQNKQKTKKRTKKKKSRKAFPPQPSPVSGMEEERPVFDDESYSALYREYQKILSKKHTKENIEANLRNMELGHEDRRAHNAHDEERQRQIRKEQQRSQIADQKKKTLQQKYLEFTDRYQRSLIQNIQALENNINASSKRTSPVNVKSERSSAKLRELEKGSSAKLSPYQRSGHEVQQVIREINSDNNLSENDYLQPEHHQLINEQQRFDKQRHEQDDSDRVYDSEGNLLEESAREIIEAAAIFIQKNYRGYRIRKLLPAILSEMYGYPFEYADEHEHSQQEGREFQGEEYEEEEHDEEEHEEEEEEGELVELEQGDYAYERAHEKKPRTIDSGVEAEHMYEYQREYQQRGDEEVEYAEEEQDSDPVFFDEHEKKSIRHLLQR